MKSENLFYRAPANDWNSALPIGNGRLGAMIYGNVFRERIQFNEESVWSGGPRDRINPDGAKYLPEIRRLLRENRIADGEKLCEKALSSLTDMPVYQTAGELEIRTEAPYSEPGDYIRCLDFDRGIFTMHNEGDGILTGRVGFASHPHDVIVYRMTCSHPMTVSLRLSRSGTYDVSRRIDDCTYLQGCTGGIPFSAALRAVPEGENAAVTVIGDTVNVTDAPALTVYVTVFTAYRTPEHEAACIAALDRARAAGYEAIAAAHEKDYRALYTRCALHLGTEEENDTPTDELRRGFPACDSLHLYNQYFALGRYLTVCGSREGTLPMTLQGIWNEHPDPPWGCRYTVNINTEMNYWHTEAVGLSECHLPLIRHLTDRMLENGRRTAKELYGCRGFVCHHNTDLYGDTAPQDRWIPGSYWPMGGAWLSLHAWEHYRYTGDREYLRQVYPLLHDAALFFADYLTPDGDGFLRVVPSVSPENDYRDPVYGNEVSLCRGCSMDYEILRELFAAVRQACGLLGTDEAFARQLSDIEGHFPPLQASRYGTLREWVEDFEETSPGHRHISHLFALYPGHTVTPETEELYRLARHTVRRRLANGGGGTGWSLCWLLCLWARLGEGEEVGQGFRTLFSRSTADNLFDLHPPFQIDGNFGAVAAMAECLVQTRDNRVYLLPALPPAWSTGRVRGLCLPGGGRLDMSWEYGVLTDWKLTGANYIVYNQNGVII